MKVTDLKFSTGPFVKSPTWTAVVSQQTHHTYLALTGKGLFNLEHKSIRNNILFWGEREAPVWWGRGPSLPGGSISSSLQGGEKLALVQKVSVPCAGSRQIRVTLRQLLAQRPLPLFPPVLIRGFQIHPCLWESVFSSFPVSTVPPSDPISLMKEKKIKYQ